MGRTGRCLGKEPGRDQGDHLTHFSKLVDSVVHGEEVVIARAGKPAARLVPLHESPEAETAGIRFGLMRGEVEIADDLDAPFPMICWPRSRAGMKLLLDTHSGSIHRDPFDRLLAAQALSEPLRLLTADKLLAGYSELVVVV